VGTLPKTPKNLPNVGLGKETGDAQEKNLQAKSKTKCLSAITAQLNSFYGFYFGGGSY
jgi:hypothetical protein